MFKKPEEVTDEDDFQFQGFTEHLIPTKYVDSLLDSELRELNALLPWKCFTVDAHGRRFGRRAWPGKRETPQPIPDRRIVRMNEVFGLNDKHVLEVGCFEGVHTVGLSMFAGQVTAVDARIENVVKTIVRCAFFGYYPAVFKCDLEVPEDVLRLPEVDVLHHVGVLYHLVDPVTHLFDLARYVRVGLMLDTHVARADQADRTYIVRGRTFKYRYSSEGGRMEVFSGMGDHSKWLTLDVILSLISEAGFPVIDVVEEREERNGLRVLLFAQR